MKGSHAIFSSKSDHWSSPEHVYEELHREFDFTFDPCPLMATEDGRKIKWTGRVFCNPPYSDVEGFLRKGLYHLAVGDCEVLVYLLPSLTGNAWFIDYCLKGEIRYIRGRLKFGGSKINAPFWSVVVIFREWKLDAESQERLIP